MRLRPPAFTVPVADPFEFDLLDRRGIAESLTELVKSSPDGLVLAIHAPWGAGKTTFLDMWRQHLQNSGLKALYFNAWQSDFSDDALVALIGELDAGLSALRAQSDGAGPSDASLAIAKVKAVGAKLLRRTAPVALKIATAGVLDLNELSEEALGDFAQKMAEDQIKAYEEASKSIAKFRESIAEIASRMNDPDAQDERMPLVLIVDELDRCRPSYSVRVLECIKHLFAVPGVAFILAVDRTQLAHSIRSQYGEGIDADGYLRRFFDLELSLPEPSAQRFCKARSSALVLLQSLPSAAGIVKPDPIRRIYPRSSPICSGHSGVRFGTLKDRSPSWRSLCALRRRISYSTPFRLQPLLSLRSRLLICTPPSHRGRSVRRR